MPFDERERSGVAALPRPLYLGGFEGRTSTRLIRVLSGIRSMPMTISAMSSGAIFQSEPEPPLRNSVATLPGMI